MASNICKWNKFAHCRYGKFCHFKHENKKCEIKDCDAKDCSLRHPRQCRNILQGKPCPFGNCCSFEHNLEDLQMNHSKNQDKTITELKNLLKSKNEEIEQLVKTIDAFNDVINLNKDDFDEESVNSDQSEIQYVEEEIFACDKCNFTTKKENGLKIH